MGERASAAKCLMDILTVNDKLGEYPNSFYAYSAHKLSSFESLQENSKCDVVIVGGGYTGLSAALSLSEKGYSVTILEAHRVAFGASGRNGGQVCSGQRWSVCDLKKTFGFEKAKMLWDVGEDAKKEVKYRINKHKIKCEFSPGILHAELKEKSLWQHESEVAQLREEHNYKEIQFLDKAGVKSYLGTDKYVGGTIDIGAGHLHPLNYGIGLARAARKSGVNIFERSRVSKVTKGSSVRVETTNKKFVDCKFLVFACNGYIGNLEPSISKRVMPINNFIVTTEPLGKNFAETLIRENVAVADSKFVVNYFRLTRDYRLLFGGGENYQYKFPKNVDKKVRLAMIDIFPTLKSKRIDYCWGGTLAVTMSRLPDFRRLSSNIYSVSGFSGQGVAMGTMAGRLLSDVIRGQSEKFDLMASLPTPMFPGGSTLRWPLMTLGMLWYSIRDKL